jgi:hypothetical protein
MGVSSKNRPENSHKGQTNYSPSKGLRLPRNAIAGNAKIADMEWAIGIFLAVMLGLYIWSHVTAGRQIGNKIQPFVDDLCGGTPSEHESKKKPPVIPKDN